MNEARKDLLVSNENEGDGPNTQPDRPRPSNGPKDANRRQEFPTAARQELVSNEGSNQGTEVIIYQTPQALPENSNFHIVIYFFVQIGSDIIAKLIMAALIISIYANQTHSFTPLALFFGIYFCWKIAFNIFFYVTYGERTPEYRKVYIFDILLAIGYVVLFFGLMEYLKGNLPASSLPFFVIPLIVLTFIRLCAGEAMETPYLPGSFLAFFESLQLLYIALKVANPPGHAEWLWVLLFFYVLTILFLILAFLLMIVFIIFLFMILFQSELIRELPNLAILAIVGVLFYIVWNGIAFYYILSGFHLLIEAGHIVPKGATGEMNPRLLYVAWFVLVCAALTLLLLFIVYCFLKDALLNYFNKNKAKEISLQSFAKNLDMNITKVSGNYFKKGKNDEENPGPKMQQSAGLNNAEQCMICCDKPSDVMIHPCGHSGVCEACLKEYIKDKDQCPMCREKVEKVYLIFYDEAKKGFMARGVIKVKN